MNELSARIKATCRYPGTSKIEKEVWNRAINAACEVVDQFTPQLPAMMTPPSVQVQMPMATKVVKMTSMKPSKDDE
jgi:hypothetical protein